MKLAFNLIEYFGDIVQRDSGGRFPKSRAFILNRADAKPVARAVAKPRLSVSLTTSRNGRSIRRDSALSFAATSSSTR